MNLLWISVRCLQHSSHWLWAKLILWLKHANEITEKGGLPNVRQREASSLPSTTWGGTRTDGAEWKRAMCDTDLPSPPRLSQRTWLHYFMSLTGNQRWCLIPTKTAWWIINARSKKNKTKHNNSNKKMHIIMYSERPLGPARATVHPSLSRSL